MRGRRPVPFVPSMDACIDTETRPHCDLENTDYRSSGAMDGQGEFQEPSGRWIVAKRFTRFYHPSAPGPHLSGSKHAYFYAGSTSVERVVIATISLGV